jgi:hypothetical protein
MSPYEPRTDNTDQLVAQVRLILEAHENVETSPPGWVDDPRSAPLRYLFREGFVLCRDSDIERVLAVVDGAAEEGGIDGLTLYRLANLGTLDALARLDAALGEGVATPNHMISICGPVHCPAIEPEPVAAGAEPAPPVSTDPDCDGKGTLVSVVDTGWIKQAQNHYWLAAGVGSDPADEEQYDKADIGPYVGHGTFMSGVIRSMAPVADVINERVPAQAAGAWDEHQMAVQLKQALAKAPDIICLASGVTSRKDRPMLGFQVFYEKYLSQVKNTVFVASAGNNGDRRPVWPAAFPWTISVGALNADALAGQITGRAAFSCFGSWVDVYAPGQDLVNAFAWGDLTYKEPPKAGTMATFDGMARWSGTSFSAPLVAGLIAARMSRNGLSAKHAADQLLRLARAHAVRGVGPALLPGDACTPAPCCDDEPRKETWKVPHSISKSWARVRLPRKGGARATP